MLRSDPDPGVRILAASSLSALAGKAPVEPLLAALGDKDDSVRVAAALALGSVPDARAAKALAKACNDTNTSVSKAAIAALAWNLEMVPEETTTGTATANDTQSTAPAGSAALMR